MYGVSVCGVDIMGNFSSNWLAIVDSSSRCSSFPSWLVDRIQAHVEGIRCGPVGCNVTDPELLPDLWFYLSDVDQSRPTRPGFRLSLRALVVGGELCLLRKEHWG